MEKIPSFTINHLSLLPGIYVSRKDHIRGETVTTFDLRMRAPNRETVMSTGAMHTMEHLGATYLRNEPVWKNRVLYFGPMGCRTGHYLLLAGDYESEDIVDLIRDTFAFIRDYSGEIPGATPRDCGNFSDQDLKAASSLSAEYVYILEHITEDRLNYPQ